MAHPFRGEAQSLRLSNEEFDVTMLTVNDGHPLMALWVVLTTIPSFQQAAVAMPHVIALVVFCIQPDDAPKGGCNDICL